MTKGVLRVRRTSDMRVLPTAARRLVNSHGGFTLPEVLITVLIMGIIFSIATTSWFGVIERRAVALAANQFAADKRLAHTSATNQLADCRLTYKADGASVTCGGKSASYCLVKVDSGGFPVERIPPTLPNNTRILGTNANLAPVLTALSPGSKRAFKFNADGSAEAVGGFVASVPRAKSYAAGGLRRW